MRKLVVAVCLLASQFAIAQNINERIGTLINESRWFELQRDLQTPACDSLAPLLKLMGKAMVKHYFNRPEAACQSLEAVLAKHQQELDGSNVLNLAYLLGVNLSRLGKYEEATTLVQSLADQLKAQHADSLYIAGFQKVADTYKVYADVGNICRPLHPEGEYTLPFHSDNKLHGINGSFIALDGHLNRTQKSMIFDTGAGMNIISSKDATECGLRRLDTYIDMQGIGLQRGQMAIADTLSIGDLKWQNVPFLIVDILTGNAEADKVISKGLAPVIGLPILLQMKEIRLDFAKQELTIPALPTSNRLGYSNLMRKDSEGLRIEARDRQDNPVYFHFDTGSSASMLSAKWFKHHKEFVLKTGQADSLRMGGVGGVIIERCYRLPEFQLQIGSGKVSMDSVKVSTGIDLHSGQSIAGKSAFNDPEEDGTIGLNLLSQFHRVIINLQEMYIEAIPYKEGIEVVQIAQ